MEEKYRVFPERHNKMLDLVEMVDPKLAKIYENVMSQMPKTILNKLQNKQEFSCDGTDYRIDFDNYDDMIEFHTQLIENISMFQ